MNTLKNSLKSHYSQIPNELITDLTLSSGELRVLLYLFTKPSSWDVYNKDICKQLGISEQTLTKYWKSLLKSKWLRREISSGSKGKFTGGYIYHIGNFTVSIQSTETVKSIEHSNNKPINKQLTNSNTKESAMADRELTVDSKPLVLMTETEAAADRIANYLLSKIIDNKPNFKKPNLKGWAKDINNAIRLDNRTEEELIECINWIYSDDGFWWIPNIQSGNKLRAQFDKMEAQMMRNKQKKTTIVDKIYDAGMTAKDMIKEMERGI